jgi:NAD(P)-dependent dehydrogenase (short-subunit alcohol dehydrogenase family)
MGKATANQLAVMGTRLLLVGRNRAKGEAAVSEIINNSGNKAITFLQADLSLVREMQRIKGHVRQIFDRLDGLVHGAGGMFPLRRTLTDEGLELVFALLYLSRHVLTNELHDLLSAAIAPQVVSIAGGGGCMTPDFENLKGEKSYSIFGAIMRAGTLNDLLTLEQIARYPDVAFYNYGPGLVRTAALTRGNPLINIFFNTIGRPFTRTAEKAANDIVALLTGKYLSGFYGPSLKQNKASVAEGDASRLWSSSEQLVDNLSI